MFQTNTMGRQAAGFAPSQPQARVGAMTAYPRYDIVGAEAGAFDKLKAWGDTETWGFKRKWLVLGVAIVGLAWYGYYARWFR